MFVQWQNINKKLECSIYIYQSTLERKLGNYTQYTHLYLAFELFHSELSFYWYGISYILSIQFKKREKNPLKIMNKIDGKRNRSQKMRRNLKIEKFLALAHRILNDKIQRRINVIFYFLFSLEAIFSHVHIVYACMWKCFLK